MENLQCRLVTTWKYWTLFVCHIFFSSSISSPSSRSDTYLDQAGKLIEKLNSRCLARVCSKFLADHVTIAHAFDAMLGLLSQQILNLDGHVRLGDVLQELLLFLVVRQCINQLIRASSVSA